MTSQAGAGFTKRDLDKAALHRLKDLAAELIGDRARVTRVQVTGEIILRIDGSEVCCSTSERKIEDKIREAGALVMKQRKMGEDTKP